MTAIAVGCASAAALSVSVLPAASALAGPAAPGEQRPALVADATSTSTPTSTPTATPTDPCGAAGPSDTPSPSDSTSPSAGPSASAAPSDCANASASPGASASPTASPYPPGPPILTFGGPSHAGSGDIVVLTGRVLGPDRRPAPLDTPVVVTALDWRQPPTATKIVDRPTINTDGTFSVLYPVTRSVVLTATATNTGSAGETAATPGLTIVVRGQVVGARLRIVHGRLAASAALTPGQQVAVKGVYAAAALYLVTPKGKVVRRLAVVAVRHGPSAGRTTFTFPLVALPPPGSRVRIFVLATQVLPASSPVMKVPVLPRPVLRPAPYRPVSSGGVHSVF